MIEDNMNDVQTFKDFEHRGWDKAAKGYSDTFALLTSQAVPALLKDAEVKPGHKVLDVACGPGLVAAAAHAAGAEATGLDLSDEMLVIAQASNPGPEYRSGDAEDLPFEAGEFDAVICNLGLYHLPRPDKALAEAFRVLRKGGRVAFTDWCAPNENPGFAMLIDALGEHGEMNVSLPPGPPPFRFGNPLECASAVKAVGFEDPNSQRIDLTGDWQNEEELLGLFLSGAVRLGSLLRAQRQESIAAIDSAMRKAAQTYKSEGRFKIPYPVLLTSARKP